MTHPSDIMDHDPRSLADIENSNRDGRIANQAQRIYNLIADAAEEAGNLAENRTVGRAFNEFARLIRKKSVKAGD